jgi:GTP-binding protein
MLSNARPKIAAYPFTTLHPHIGMVDLDKDIDPVSVADLPGKLARVQMEKTMLIIWIGIIEGAHNNKGLGFEFLRHIERTKILLFVLDMSHPINDPYEEYQILRNELKMYNEELLDREYLIVANKMDQNISESRLESLTRKLQEDDEEVDIIPISAQLNINLDYLKSKLKSLTVEVRKKEALSEPIKE